MRTVVRRVLVPGVMIAALLGTGCAARKAYRQGQSEARQGNWDTAVARLTKALELDPENIGYKITLENARIQASRMHHEQGERLMAADDLEGAADEFEIAFNYDSANKAASDALGDVRQRLLERDAERRRLSDYEQLKGQVQAAPYPVPVLSPRDPVPIRLNFPDQSLEKVFEALSKLSGVNILFDDGYRDKRDTVVLSGVTLQQAIDQIVLKNRLFYKVLDQNTLIVVPDTPAKRRAYEDQLVQTFFLENADANEMLNLVKSLTGIQKAAANVNLGSLTLMASPDQLHVAAQILERNDKALGEVLVEVEILQVSRDQLKRYGLELSNYEAGVTFSPTGAEGEVAGGFTNVRAHLLSSINMADWVVSIPSTLFARFLQTDATVKILASPRLRASEGKKTSLRIGTEVPIPVTTFTATQAGTSTFAPATSFQYRNVGINLEMTPKVMASGEITLDLNAEFSLLGEDRNVGTGNNPVIVPTFLTRNVTGTLRVRDGETSLIGGLLQEREAASLRGAFGLSSIPILGTLFTSNQKASDETEILISLTPRLVRGPMVTKADLAPAYAGTGEGIRVPEARPLFGAPTPTPAEATGVVEPGPPAAAEGAPPGDAAASDERVPEEQPAPSPPTAGQAGVRFTPETLSLPAGEVGSLSVVLLGTADLRGVEVRLSFDPAHLEFVAADPGPLLTLDGAAVGAERQIAAGTARIRFTRAAATSGSGVVVDIEFEATGPGRALVMLDAVTVMGPDGERSLVVPGPVTVEVEP